MRPDEIPLRERNYARNRLALMDAAVERMGVEEFDEIKIRDLCRMAEVSEASFYNYFPKKSDLLYYFIQLWGIEVVHYATRVARAKSALGILEEIFAYTADRTATNPAIMGEIIAFQARMKERPEIREVSVAERILAFPDIEGIEDISAGGLDYILPHYVRLAVANGELPCGTDVQTVIVALASIFFGVPLILGMTGESADVAAMYKEELAILWRGVGAKTRR